MGLLKLAVIGGVAFWAGSRYNEKHEGGCHRKRQMDRSHPHQPDNNIPQNPTTPDSYYYYHGNEKPVQFSHDQVRDVKQSPPANEIEEERATSAPPVYGYRRSSLKLAEQPQQQIESPRYQQMVFVEPKSRYVVDQPAWK